MIDDVQLVGDSNAAEVFIEEFVRATQVPLLICSRSRPSWVTAKSLLYGEFVELGRNVLAMTHSEAAEALAHTHDEMPGLVALAEGWPAVIGLAALLPYPLQEGASEVPETLHQYFAEELYDAVSADARWSAVQLSLGSAIDGGITRALFGNGATHVLEEAHESGFLTKSVSGFEMHPLVRQFLRTKLTEFEPENIRATAETIANAYANAARWDEAASVGTEFGFIDVMLRVLTDALDAHLSEGRLTTLNRWLDIASRSAPAAPIVQVASIEVDFRAGDWAAAKGKALNLVRQIPTDSPLASRAYLRAGQIAHLEDRMDDALQLLTEAKVQAQSSQDLRNALWSRFMALCDVEKRAETEAALHELEQLPQVGPDDLLREGQGRLQFAVRWGPVVETLEAVSGLLDSVDASNDPLVRTGFLQTYGSALGLLARYDEAATIAKRQIKEAEDFKLDWVLPHALEMRAVAQIGKREFDAALRGIAQARRLAEERGSLHTQVNALVLSARIHLCCGAPERAVEALEARESGFTSSGMEGEYLATQGFALACCCRGEEAKELVKESESVSAQIDAAAIRHFTNIITTHLETGELQRELLVRALAETRKTGNFNAFVCAYRAFPPLLDKMRQMPAGETKLFTAIVSTLDKSLAERFGLQRASRTKKGEPLTKREGEVLDFMQQGLSNREIAKTLWISESTVKVHVHHVLTKLGVRSRTEAVAISMNRD